MRPPGPFRRNHAHGDGRFLLPFTADQEVGVTAGALIKPDAFARASIIDMELDWPRGLAIGKIASIYSQAQADKGKSIVRRRMLLEWAGIADAAEGDRFLELCCKACSDDTDDHIHFLEPRGEDRYFIVGNPKHLEKIATYKARASGAGVASGKVRAKKAAAKRPDRTPSSTPSSASCSTPSSSTSSPQVELESNPLPSPIPIPIPNPFQSPTDSDSAREAPGAESSQSVRGKRDSLSPDALVALWNEVKGRGMRHATGMTTTRRIAAGVALGRHPDPAYWREAIERLAAIPYANGEVPTAQCPKGFHASLPWFIDNHVAVSAGAFDPHDDGEPAPHWSSFMALPEQPDPGKWESPQDQSIQPIEEDA